MATLVAMLVLGACGSDGGESTSSAESTTSGRDGVPASLETPDLTQSAAFSDDGQRLAIVSGLGSASSLQVADLETGELTDVSPGNLQVKGVTWLDDNSLLVGCASEQDNVEMILGEPPDDLCIVPLDGGEHRRLAVPTPIVMWDSLAASADGSYAVVTGVPHGSAIEKPRLAQVDLETGAFEWLTTDPAEYQTWPIITDDGQLYFAGGAVSPSDGSVETKMFGVLNAGQPEYLTPEDQVILDPTYARNDDALFAGCGTLYGNDAAICRYDLDSGSLERVRENTRRAFVNPDGTLLAIPDLGFPTSRIDFVRL